MIINKNFILRAISIPVIAFLSFNVGYTDDSEYDYLKKGNSLYVKGSHHTTYVGSNKFDASSECTKVTKKSATEANSGTVSGEYNPGYNPGFLGGSLAVGFKSENGLGFEVEGIYSHDIKPKDENQYFYYLQNNEGVSVTDNKLTQVKTGIKNLYKSSGDAKGVKKFSETIGGSNSVKDTKSDDYTIEVRFVSGNIANEPTTTPFGSRNTVFSLNKLDKFVVDDPGKLDTAVNVELDKLVPLSGNLLAANGVKIPIKYQNKGFKYAAALANMYYSVPVSGENLNAYVGVGAGIARVAHTGYDNEVISLPLAIQGKIGATFNLGSFTPYIGYRALFLTETESLSEMNSARNDITTKIANSGSDIDLNIADAAINIQVKNGNDNKAFDDIKASYAQAQYNKKIKSSFLMHSLEVGIMAPFNM